MAKGKAPTIKLDLESTIEAIEQKTLSEDKSPMLRRYGSIATAVLRNGEDYPVERALRLERIVRAAEHIPHRMLRVAVDFDDSGRTPDSLTYALGLGGTIRFANVVTLRLTHDDPTRHATVAIGMGENQMIERDDLSEMIRNMYAFDGTLDDLRENAGKFEQTLTDAGFGLAVDPNTLERVEEHLAAVAGDTDFQAALDEHYSRTRGNQ